MTNSTTNFAALVSFFFDSNIANTQFQAERLATLAVDIRTAIEAGQPVRFRKTDGTKKTVLNPAAWAKRPNGKGKALASNRILFNNTNENKPCSLNVENVLSINGKVVTWKKAGK